jgi:hypothetical protein
MLGAGRAVGSGFRVFLTISGLTCRAEGAARERSRLSMAFEA